jgi:lipopolysaccharide/colanic/teichoic acid biosynthesis glycosyltransferase
MSRKTDKKRAPRLGRQRAKAPGWKRCLDLGMLLALLPFMLPVFLLTALWIKAVSRGPAFFCQDRIGKDGKRFKMYKFRSMRHGVPTSPHIDHVRRLVEADLPLKKLDAMGDSRLIPGGGFIRHACLDELPQLLNVIRGEMSLVGPRPCLPEEFEFFSKEQMTRFRVLPGLTGHWQVSGKNSTTFSEMGALDSHYSSHASVWMDLAIVAKTPPAILSQIHRHFVNTSVRRGIAHLSHQTGTRRSPAGSGTRRLQPAPIKTRPLLATGEAPQAHRYRSWSRRS